MVAGSKNGAVLVLKLIGSELELEEAYTEEHTSNVISCAWQPDGNKFTSLDTIGNLIVWD